MQIIVVVDCETQTVQYIKSKAMVEVTYTPNPIHTQQ